MNDGLPPMEKMMEDLAKVPGLDFLWSSLAMVLAMPDDSPFTKREMEIIKEAQK